VDALKKEKGWVALWKKREREGGREHWFLLMFLKEGADNI